MTDRYQPLRDAIAAGPTPGPWFAVNDGTEDEPMMSVKAARIAGRKPQHVVAICATGDSPQEMEDANAALIAAASPDVIAELLRERDALRADSDRLRWLTEDHADPEARNKCREILGRMPVMSYSAACMVIDSARAALADGEAQS